MDDHIVKEYVDDLNNLNYDSSGICSLFVCWFGWCDLDDLVVVVNAEFLRVLTGHC